MNSRKGFTLVELIVTLGISITVLVAVLSVVLSSTNIANRTERRADAELIAESLVDEIRSKANFARTIVLGSDNSVHIGNTVLKVNDEGYPVFTEGSVGTETYKENLIFDRNFYKGKTVKLLPSSVPNSERINLTVQVCVGDSVLAEVTTTLESAVKTGIPVEILSKTMEWNHPAAYTANQVILYGNELYLVKKDFKLNATDDDIFNQGPEYVENGTTLRLLTDRIYHPSDLVDNKISNIQPGNIYVADADSIYVYVNYNSGDTVEAPKPNSTIPNGWVRVQG